MGEPRPESMRTQARRFKLDRLASRARFVSQAVEPSMKVDKKDKGILAFAPVAGVAALALLSIPLLPTLFAANPDQV